jgi:hypothetical protein
MVYVTTMRRLWLCRMPELFDVPDIVGDYGTNPLNFN